jgi:hypothetical protein
MCVIFWNFQAEIGWTIESNNVHSVASLRKKLEDASLWATGVLEICIIGGIWSSSSVITKL